MAENSERIVARVGRSRHRRSGEAAREALAPLLKDGLDYRLLLVYSSIDHDHETILNVVRQHLPDAPVIGCTTTGEIAPDERPHALGARPAFGTRVRPASGPAPGQSGSCHTSAVPSRTTVPSWSVTTVARR